MSGGHYTNHRGTYLCITDVDEIVANEYGIRAMADDLAELGYADDAAAETEELILIIRQFRNRADARLKRLQPIWKAMDWWKACDWSEESVKTMLKEYRGES